ncbi:hypothetical protein [Nocardioides marinquilinus]|uniref:hypothetical protein n=1 Tax=Nocardioides marinquilinus TaxID=1210400 RepID=UPI0031ECB223
MAERSAWGRAAARSAWAAWAAWPLLLAVVLLAPLLVSGGIPLARDLVFVPRQPFSDAVLGLTDGSPRAVPLDAVVSLLTLLVDGEVLARLVLPLSVALAGWGVLRVLAGWGTAPRLAASAMAVWNPFVVERLALGQWALLLAYGCLPWIAVAATRHRRDGAARDGAAALAWTALASLTPTGGLLALATLLACGARRSRPATVVGLVGVLLQAPWVVAALLSGAGVSDPAGVAAFAPDTEAASGPVVALLGLGGIWDAAAEPATRTTWVAVAAAVIVVMVVAVGWPRLHRAWSRDLVRPTVVAAAGAALALLSAVGPGQEVLRWAVETVPGAGLLRDGQKLLAPAVLLVAVALGGAVARVEAWLADRDADVRRAALLPLLAAPVVLLPDATTVTWPTVEPVVVPADLREAVTVVDGTPDDELVVTLPWRSYRSVGWGNGLTASDPMTRWSSARVVTDDDLVVGSTAVEGESAVASRVDAALSGGAGPERLGGLGVGRVVVYRDAPGADEVDVAGLSLIFEGPHVAVYAVPDPRPVPPVGGARRAAVVGAHLGFGVIALGCLAVARRRRTAGASDARARRVSAGRRPV